MKKLLLMVALIEAVGVTSTVKAEEGICEYVAERAEVIMLSRQMPGKTVDDVLVVARGDELLNLMVYDAFEQSRTTGHLQQSIDKFSNKWEDKCIEALEALK